MPHPLDLNYELLKASLSVVDQSSDEFKLIEKYLRATESGYRKLQIIDVWRVDRHGVVSILCDTIIGILCDTVSIL